MPTRKTPGRLGNWLASSGDLKRKTVAETLPLCSAADFFPAFFHSTRPALRPRKLWLSPPMMRRRPASFLALALLLFLVCCCCCCCSSAAAQNNGNSNSKNKNALLLFFASPPEAPSLREAPFRPPPGAPLRVISRLKPIDDSSVRPNVRREERGVVGVLTLFLSPRAGLFSFFSFFLLSLKTSFPRPKPPFS